MIVLILWLLATVSASPTSENKDSYKNQYCTDPRTMKKHPAYTEWADAYSCTRHRCQPGGRNLAIYTVGCKRVEAPESAIECEEVVEDTNMQFPFCCTRLRCLVVVRGEVWTRVLGQPWEVLPAAPWSHMYKMKKPPPADSTFLPKTIDQGPVYELSENESEQSGHDKVLRAGKKPVTDTTDYNEIPPIPVSMAGLPPPDIVIALSTNERKESSHKKISRIHGRRRHSSAQPPANYFEEEEKQVEPVNQEMDEVSTSTERPQDAVEEENEKFFDNNNDAATHIPPHKSHNTFKNPPSWSEIPQNPLNEPKEAQIDGRVSEYNNNYQPPEPKQEALQMTPKKDPAEKASNLQTLVDAIGTRMRDIESVVQKMSDKVSHQGKPAAESSNEKRMSAERDGSHKRRKGVKRPSGEDENYKRFNVRTDRRSKYLHSSSDSTTEKPLYIEDTNSGGYFSDASNSILRTKKIPKEPAPTYMAPVIENRRKAPAHIAVPDNGDDVERKRKKHGHKKRKSKASHSHKKHSHSKDDRRKRFNRLSSGETEKNAVSLDDSSDVAQ